MKTNGDSADNQLSESDNNNKAAKKWPTTIMLIGLMSCGFGMFRAGAYEDQNAVKYILFGILFMIAGFVGKRIKS